MAGKKKKWSPPKVDKNGFQVDKDGLPLARTARAMALAQKGTKEDKAGICTKEQIAAFTPAPTPTPAPAAAEE